MNRRAKRDIIATLLRQGKPELVKVVTAVGGDPFQDIMNSVEKLVGGAEWAAKEARHSFKKLKASPRRNAPQLKHLQMAFKELYRMGQIGMKRAERIHPYTTGSTNAAPELHGIQGPIKKGDKLTPSNWSLAPKGKRFFFSEYLGQYWYPTGIKKNGNIEGLFFRLSGGPRKVGKGTVSPGRAAEQFRFLGDISKSEDHKWAFDKYDNDGRYLRASVVTGADFDTAAKGWLKKAQGVLDAYYKKDSGDHILELTAGGKKYVRVVKVSHGKNKSAFGFICRETGNVLKADGWKRPARGPRGNIYSGKLGINPAMPMSVK